MHKLIKSQGIYGIIGLAKNTGKTTTLNHIISHHQDKPLGITSIGLDGEALDQIFDLPKPQIMLYQGHIAATTDQCLIGQNMTYDILHNTHIQTSMGEVLIIRMNKPTKVLIAGPHTKKTLNELLKLMKHYVDLIIVDGAFNRMSHASLETFDHIILTTGASYHSNMDETVKKTYQILKTFSYPKTQIVYNQKSPLMYMKNHKFYELPNKSEDTFKIILNQSDIKAIGIKGALTEKMMKTMLGLGLKNQTIIIEDPTKLMISPRYQKYLEIENIKIEVLNQIPILAITINPWSPDERSYDSNQFMQAIKKLTHIPVYNLKDKETSDAKTTS